MNLNQRYGFIKSIIEDQQRAESITEIQMMNFQHYIDTGEWLNEEIKFYNRVKDNKDAVEALARAANEATIFLEGAPRYKTWHWECVDEYKKFIEGAIKAKEELSTELNKLRAEEGEIAKQIDSISGAADNYRELLAQLKTLGYHEQSKSICFEYPDGTVWTCSAERIGNKIVLRPKKEVKL